MSEKDLLQAAYRYALSLAHHGADAERVGRDDLAGSERFAGQFQFVAPLGQSVEGSQKGSICFGSQLLQGFFRGVTVGR